MATTAKRTRPPTAHALARAVAVLARQGLVALPNADLTALREQAAAAPPVDSLDRDLSAMTQRR